MHLFQDATITCPKDQAKIYQWALGEFAEDPETGEPDRSKPINEIKFPLSGVQVVQHGNRATISIPRPGKSAFQLDRLIRCSDPKKTTQDGGEVFVITGESERLFQQGINPADAQVDFTIINWAGRLAPASKT